MKNKYRQYKKLIDLIPIIFIFLFIRNKKIKIDLIINLNIYCLVLNYNKLILNFINKNRFMTFKLIIFSLEIKKFCLYLEFFFFSQSKYMFHFSIKF
jgi:hypothetical protein